MSFSCLLVLVLLGCFVASLEQSHCSSLSSEISEALSLDAVIERREVVIPTITSPNAGTVWYWSTLQTVLWETRDLPPYEHITNKLGEVYLGHDSGDGKLNLDLDNPIAHSFNITDGSVEVLVPGHVPPGSSYLIVLMGVSGNRSPSFSILSHPDAPLPEPSESTSPPSSQPTSTTAISSEATPRATPSPSRAATNSISNSGPINRTTSTTEGGGNSATVYPTFGDPFASPSNSSAAGISGTPAQDAISNNAMSRGVGLSLVSIGAATVNILASPLFH